VRDLAAVVAAIRGHGVAVYEGEHMQGLGYQAMVLDPSGNLIELNQPD
jgi:predicted enzyme related to lactoylglutathione lyase